MNPWWFRVYAFLVPVPLDTRSLRYAASRLLRVSGVPSRPSGCSEGLGVGGYGELETRNLKHETIFDAQRES